MKRLSKKAISLLLTVVMVLSLAAPEVFAAGARKGYTITSGNTTAYSNTGLTKKLGTIYGTDELTIIDVTGRYTKVSYPLSRGGTKTGYIPTSAVLTKTSGTTKKALGQITTYRRNNKNNTYGYISKGDDVLILGTSGSYTQVKYPVSGGYKYAFITTSDANNKLGGSSNTQPISNGTYKLASAINNNYVWDISGGSAASGANLQLYQDNGTNAQRFKITYNSDGYYTITNINSGKAIDCYNADSADGTNIWQYDSNNTAAQRWKIESAGNGYYTLICKCNGKAADVSGGIAGNGSNIQIYHSNGTNAQKFKFIAAGTASNPPSVATSSTMTNALYKINVSGSKITCGFDGYVNTKGRHEGIDFKYGNGKPVYSLTDGVITRVTNGYNGSSGLSTIAIYDSANNKTVVYLHSQPLSSLKVNKKVSRGEQIATESWRGISSASAGHTHVEVRNGRATAAAKSVNDYTLENPNPASYWKSLGYDVK